MCNVFAFLLGHVGKRCLGLDKCALALMSSVFAFLLCPVGDRCLGLDKGALGAYVFSFRLPFVSCWKEVSWAGLVCIGSG